MPTFTDRTSRLLKHTKAEKPKMGVGIPDYNDGYEGETRIQMVEGNPRLYLKTNAGWFFTGLVQDGAIPDIPTASSTQLGVIKIGSGGTIASDGTYTATAATPAADDITGGDAAVTISTSSGNITIDAAANNSNIIFKGTDATSDITMLTLSGADAGAATFNNKIIATELDISGNVDIDGTLESDAYTVNGTALNTYIASITVTNATNAVTATNATHVTITDNESTAENNLITFIENEEATGNRGLESDGNFFYTPSTGRVTSTQFSGLVVTATQGTIDHDSLANFVANEHIDWTSDQGSTNIHSGNYTDTNTVDMGDGFKLLDADSNHDVTEGHYVKFITQEGTAGTGVISGNGSSGNPWVVTLNGADTNTVDMGDGFVLEDADGTEVTITENKEIKFIECTGLDINWTDTSTGSDGDPYDLTFTLAASLQTLSGLNVGDGNFIVGNGSAFIVESGATARTSLGLGTAATRADSYFKESDDVESPALGGTGVTSTTAYKNVLDDETWTFANATTFSSTITSGGHLIDGVSNYNGLEVKGSGGSRPQIQWSNANNGDLGVIYATEGQALIIGTGNSNTTAITIDSSQVCLFASTIRGSADVVAYYSSDPSLKENKKLIQSPLDKISQLGGYSFDWKDEARDIVGDHLNGKDYGVMADEVQALFPELVDTRSNGIRAVKYDKLVPLLIEGIKELKEELNMIKDKS